MVDVTKSCQLPELATPHVDLFPTEFVENVTLAYCAVDNSVMMTSSWLIHMFLSFLLSVFSLCSLLSFSFFICSFSPFLFLFSFFLFLSFFLQFYIYMLSLLFRYGFLWRRAFSRGRLFDWVSLHSNTQHSQSLFKWRMLKKMDRISSKRKKILFDEWWRHHPFFFFWKHRER